MLINASNLDLIFKGFNTAFNKGLSEAPSRYRDVAMVVPSETGETEYGWLGETPAIREWLGDRHINSLMASSYTIKNRRFESTVAVQRTQIEDDKYGVMSPVYQKMGRDAALFPDSLVFALLSAGFHEPCYDGQPFFDAEHRVIAENGADTLASNFQDGEGEPWFLLDCSQPIKPLIYQERIPFEFQHVDKPSDPHVFFRDEYVYGTRGRGNAGFGLWQLGFGSKAELNAVNYEAARAAMQNRRGDNGKRLGITATHLVVSPTLEGKARSLLVATHLANGATNVWSGSAEMIMTPYLG
ncbi:Mu-like prophage major head subunit gpT family protein [Salinarimonas chemoclinalis]|uniref:Mu-like prophage major head subunit gpT family protein n=1 Tax=Salinarimonas chemoclinalis TaxID=3241599 RepID=UPI003557BA83